MRLKSYSELIKLPTFEERFRYLKLSGEVGASTFGFDRYLNQKLYTSKDWRSARDFVIIRDNACDLGILGRDIFDAIRVHHMNSVTLEDFETGSRLIFDPEFLICTSLNTHNAIHFGDENNLIRLPKERRKGDTIPWKVY